MKPHLFLLLQLLMLCLLSCCMNIPDDSEIFTAFEPVEWSDDFVFAGTNSPQSVQIWNRKTRSLVHTYSLIKDDKGRFLDIYDMQVLDRSVWLVCKGKRYNLLRIDVESGKADFKRLGFIPEQIAAVPKEEDGRGTLWVNSFGYPGKGMDFAYFDSDGSCIEEFNLPHKDIMGSDINVSYINGNYYMTACQFSRFHNTDKEQEGFYVLNLSEKKSIPVEYLSVFPKGFLTNEVAFEPGLDFISRLQIFKVGDKKIVDTTCTGPGDTDIAHRILFMLKSIEPFEIEYMNINWNMKREFSFSYGNGKYYTAGKLIHSADDFYGLEISVYDEKGGEEEKCFRLPRGNQIYCQSDDDETWFSKNTWALIESTASWDKSDTPEIYRLVHSTGEVFKYSQDGTETAIREKER